MVSVGRDPNPKSEIRNPKPKKKKKNFFLQLVFKLSDLARKSKKNNFFFSDVFTCSRVDVLTFS